VIIDENLPDGFSPKNRKRSFQEHSTHVLNKFQFENMYGLHSCLFYLYNLRIKHVTVIHCEGKLRSQPL